MKIFLQTAFMLLLVIGVPGKASAQDRSFKPGSFKEIRLTGPFTVLLTIGETESVRIDAQEEDWPQVDVSVKDGVLLLQEKEIDNSKKNQKYSTMSKVTIHVSAKSLDVIDVSGAGSLQLENELKAGHLRLTVSATGHIKGAGLWAANQLSLMLSGAGKMNLALEVDQLHVLLSGSGKMVLKGSAEHVGADISGASDYDSGELRVKSFNLNVSGAANAKLHASESLKSRVTGIGRVKYSGNPTILESHVTGMGKLSKIDG